MKKKAVTIYDIAQRLKLSPSTVSRGLRSDPRIRDETKLQIAETARQMGYQANRVAAGLRGGSTATIGVIVPRIDRHFFASAISGIEQVARKRGYQVIITQSSERLVAERENVAALTAARVDGIIASLSIETNEAHHFDRLSDRSFPLVFFDRVSSNVNCHRVILDDRESARTAVQHLIAGGVRRIAHLGGPEHSNVYAERYRGYRAALTEAGILIPEGYVVRDCVDEQRGYRELQQLMELPQPPEGIFTASDFAAIGVYRYCREHDIRIPDDLAVVSFANEPFTQIINPALSTVEQFSERMGRVAAELLFRQIDSGDEDIPIETIVIPGELMIRDSSRRNIIAVDKTKSPPTSLAEGF